MTRRLNPRQGADEKLALDLPPIQVTTCDHRCLSGVVEAFRLRGRGAQVELLARELDRAELVEPASVARDVVTMRSHVTFVDHGTGKGQTLTLVYPGEESRRQRKLAVVTPVGSALLGLRVGVTMSWRTMEGETKRLTVLEVEEQPEMHGFYGVSAPRWSRPALRPPAWRRASTG